MGTLNVGVEGLLATIVPPGLQSIVGNITTLLDLRLIMDCNLNNAGRITASGNLPIDSRTTINNAADALIFDVLVTTLFSLEGTFFNAGTIAFSQGSVTFNTVPGRDMVLTNIVSDMGGLIGALQAPSICGCPTMPPPP